MNLEEASSSFLPSPRRRRGRATSRIRQESHDTAPPESPLVAWQASWLPRLTGSPLIPQRRTVSRTTSAASLVHSP